MRLFWGGTLEEFRRQLFGTKSERTKVVPADAGEKVEDPAAKTFVKEHARKKEEGHEGRVLYGYPGS